MLDSLLTLTKGRFFWMLGAAVLAAILHSAIVAVTGVQEPMFLLGALLLPVALLVMGVYTLGKKLFRS